MPRDESGGNAPPSPPGPPSDRLPGPGREPACIDWEDDGFLSRSRIGQRARKLLKDYDVRGGGPETRAASLSGGNQQKVVIARELTADPQVIIAAQPTRGLDVGAIEFVHRRLIEERDAGKAILLVSLELEEILSLSDRIIVLYEGTIAGTHTGEASADQIGLEMLGGAERTAA